jgi:hypothetical protein
MEEIVSWGPPLLFVTADWKTYLSGFCPALGREVFFFGRSDQIETQAAFPCHA